MGVTVLEAGSGEKHQVIVIKERLFLLRIGLLPILFVLDNVCNSLNIVRNTLHGGHGQCHKGQDQCHDGQDQSTVSTVALVMSLVALVVAGSSFAVSVFRVVPSLS